MLEKDQKVALCRAIRTTRYSRKIVSLLRDLSDSLYKTDSPSSLMTLETSLEDDLFGVFKNLFGDADQSNVMESESRYREVIEYIKNIPEVSFTVPVHPSKSFVSKLYDWCAENLSEEILMDFTTNRLMDSGLVMVYKGHYFEYSLENLLNEYFSTHDTSKYLQKEN